MDEIPQLLNVIKNDMSIVGPRPERPHFVEKLKKEIPYYYKRMTVKPGITGWAQVKHKYDASLDDVKEKLQYDFYYIENISLRMDFKIMINTILVILLMKGH
jgi:lipopolysaccharide/colanic/teichoic acid biosynthesis glycosyltransferase